MAARIGIAIRILLHPAVSHLRSGAIGRREHDRRSAAPRDRARRAAGAAQKIIPHHVDGLRDECRNRRIAGLCLSDQVADESGLLPKIDDHRFRDLGHESTEEPSVRRSEFERSGNDSQRRGAGQMVPVLVVQRDCSRPLAGVYLQVSDVSVVTGFIGSITIIKGSE